MTAAGRRRRPAAHPGSRPARPRRRGRVARCSRRRSRRPRRLRIARRHCCRSSTAAPTSPSSPRSPSPAPALDALGSLDRRAAALVRLPVHRAHGAPRRPPSARCQRRAAAPRQRRPARAAAERRDAGQRRAIGPARRAPASTRRAATWPWSEASRDAERLANARGDAAPSRRWRWRSMPASSAPSTAPFPCATIECSSRCREHLWIAGRRPGSTSTGLYRLRPSARPRRGCVTRIAAAVDGADVCDIECRAVSPERRGALDPGEGAGLPRPVRPAAAASTASPSTSAAQKQLESERERAAVAEREARAEAEHADRMKDEFLATLSHELRTPLSAILGWTHAAARPATASTERRQGASTTIERNARAQAQLIEDLLDVTRIISGKLRLDMQPRRRSAPVFEAALAVAAAGRRRQGRRRCERPIGAEPSTVHGRSRPAAAGRLEPAVQRHQVHARRAAG